ncbi:hypothetical protein SCP_0408610 [Sparassis crispa]|uniref:Uncharacterized protein n=1 Tax=Sparassis crispa TaxID=139825 RepID=A0A401GJY2_9APHY|nr:hypothetical protein SCP_0408610 [Sparassis crispa]GBE82477.1 hypothetical protein SCP_0408610 [Sparassis crispa]
MASPSVPIGNVPDLVHQRAIVTSARDAETHLTALINAILQRRFHPLTPLRAEGWHELLSDSGLLTRYPFIVHSIRHSFDVGIKPIPFTNTPPNSRTLLEHNAAFQNIVRHELQQGRYLGPMSRATVESLIGPFQSSPLSLVPKPHKPGVFRLVQNFSFPRTPSAVYTSINYHIDSDNYPCTWGTFTAFSLLCWRVPPGSEGAVRDVSEAYRIIPLASSQWPGTVVRLSEGDEFALDTSAAFGVTSNAGVYGSVADAGADIMRSKGIGPLSKWVDDHIFIRLLRSHLADYNHRREEWRTRIEAHGGRHHTGGRFWFGGDLLPDGRTDEFDEDMAWPLRDLSQRSPRSDHDARFTYNLDDIDSISSHLGIPWKQEKDIPFSSCFPFTGFSWDLETRTVAIPPAKAAKYRTAIEDWSRSRTHSLLDVQKLYGKLLHASLVATVGRAYLTNLEAMLGLFSNCPFKLLHPPSGTTADLEWWTRALSQPTLSRPIPGPCELADVHAYSDASSGIGIGVVIGERWRAWHLLPDWKRDLRDIGWAEAVGFELLVRLLLTVPSFPRHLKVYGDNKGVVEGWWNGRSRNRQVNLVFQHLHSLLGNAGSSIHTRYIPSQSNPADAPSRGIYPKSLPLLPAIEIPPELHPFLVNFDAPPTSAERHLLQQGRRIAPLTKVYIDRPAAECASLNFERDRQSDELLWHGSYWDD